MNPTRPNQPALQALPPVEPDIHQWPIYKLSQKRLDIVDHVVKEVTATLGKAKHAQQLQMIADAYYQERKRIKEAPWKVDPKDEHAFWSRIRSRLQAVASHDAPEQESEEILGQIISRYAHEIAGDFRPRTFRFARTVLSFFFSRVFSAASEGWFKGLFASQKSLAEKMQIQGEVEHVRKLASKGTLIVVPTHFSNLDSVVVGWAMQHMGLPALTYGAGINLFGHPVLSFFMSRLGAFRVDRRKKNNVYLETLKSYTRYMLHHNGHMLFFPGGTRSRGGNIETKLKLGLLGTAFDAQQKLVEENPEAPHKLFVVPLVIGYHTVLEAQNLVDEHLRQEGKERYVMLKDDFGNIWQNLKFIWNFFKSPSEMVFSIGKPMDLFGNPVDMEGNSLDRQGNPIDISYYFRSRGVIREDAQRNQAYTRMLGDEILLRFYRENVVFSSHVVAFVACSLLLKRHKGDIYALLTVSEEDLVISKSEFCSALDHVLVRLRELERAGKLRLSPHVQDDPTKVLMHGVRNLGIYHVHKPLLLNEKDEFITENTRLLYFYHNRLKGYDLAKYV
jgi:glycerol-3-phosphate O-acyltransferase